MYTQCDDSIQIPPWAATAPTSDYLLPRVLFQKMSSAIFWQSQAAP